MGGKKTDLENTDVIIMTQTRVIDSNVTITDVLCVQNGALCNSMASRTLRADEAINQIEKKIGASLCLHWQLSDEIPERAGIVRVYLSTLFECPHTRLYECLHHSFFLDMLTQEQRFLSLFFFFNPRRRHVEV